MRDYVLAILLAPALVCLPSGCGSQSDRDDAEPPPAKAGEDNGGPQTDSSHHQDDPDGPLPPNDSDADSAAEESPLDTPDQPPAPAKPDFARQLARIRELQRDAQFGQALRIGRELRAADPAHPRAEELATLIVRLQDFHTAGFRVRYALEKLGPGNSVAAQAAARQKLLEAGDLGLLLLAKVVREREGPWVSTALELIEQQQAGHALPSLLERAASRPAGPQTPAVLETARALLSAVPPDRREALSDRFAALFGRLLADTDFSRHHIAGLLIDLLDQWFDSDFAAFNDYLQAPEATAYLETYLWSAATSKRDQLQRWALNQQLTIAQTSASLVGWWTFDQIDNGHAPDRSGHERHGTIHGATRVNGQYNNALSFDGDDDYVRIPDARALSGGKGAARTISVVFKTSAPDGFQPLVEKQWDASSGDWGLSVNNGQLDYYSESHTFSDYRAAGGKVPTNRWLHAVTTLRQTDEHFDLRFYIDGEPVLSRSVDQWVSVDTRGDVYIAARRYENRQAKGQGKVVVDDVRLYDRWMEPHEVAMLDPGAYLKARYQQTDPAVMNALIDHLLAEGPALQQRILLTALERIGQGVKPDQRAGYRSAAARLIEAAQAHRVDGELPAPWDRTIDTLAHQWFDGDQDALIAWAVQ